MTGRWTRWSPLLGIASVVLLIVAFGVSGETPGSNDSDEEITSYWATNSHQTRNIAAWFVFLAGVLLLIAFLSVLRGRLAAAEAEPRRASTLLFGAGVASAAFLLAAATVWTSPAFAANDSDRFRLDADTYRLLNDLAYLLWVAGIVVAALVAWATAAVALRGAVLPPWFGWVSVAVGVVLLAGVLFFPFFVYMAWILAVAIMLVVRPLGWARPAAAPATSP